MPALDHSNIKDLYPLKAIKNEKDYKEALKSMAAVFDETKGHLAEYAETLTILIEYYESKHFPIKDSTGIDVLNFLMVQNDLKQKDLVGVLGEKSSDVFKRITGHYLKNDLREEIEKKRLAEETAKRIKKSFIQSILNITIF